MRHQTRPASLDAPHRVSAYSKQNQKEFIVPSAVVRRCAGQAVRLQSAWNKAPALEKSWDAITGWF